MKLPVALIFLRAFELCTAERILYLIPVPSTSHYILSEPLVEELARRGHEITVLSHFKRLKPLKNVNEIVVPDVSDSFIKSDRTLPPETEEEKLQLREKIPLLYSTNEGMEALLDNIMTYAPVIDLLNSNQKIDLVVGHCISMEGILAGFSHRFNAPMVFISSSAPSTHVNEIVGNPTLSSYVPDGSLGFTDNMTFYQRLVNFLFTIYAQIMFYVFHLPHQEKLMRKYFGEELPPLKELALNNSLILINHHHSLAYPRPYFPSMIEIGGFHVKPAKPLPKDLENYMDEAEDGVIYVSMGSNLQSSKLTKETVEGILRAFSYCSQKVLWKFENENSLDLPGNVKVSKWLPQSDILAHPKLRLFITHGGFLTLTESIFRGVPVIVIPAFPEQETNVRQIENLEVGAKLEFDKIRKETMFDAIQEVLNNPKYANNAKFQSQILRDRPLAPIDTAVYWLEYVMRYEGAPHLRSGARRLAWYQLYLLDVLIFLGVVLLLGIFVMSKLYCQILKIIKRKEDEKRTSFLKDQ